MASKHHSLNLKQIQLLKLLYKFRFVSSDFLARYKGVSRSSMNYSLDILRDQQLIGRRFDNTRKITGKGAMYYLTAAGVKELKQHVPLNDAVVHALYKNGVVTEDFMQTYLTVADVCLALKNTYPDTFTMLTAAEAAPFNHLPKPRPNLYISRKELSNSTPNDYFLDVITDTRRFAIKNKLNFYSEYYESGTWGKSAFPALLLVCPDAASERKALAQIEPLLVDFDIYVTTIKALLHSDTENLTVWSATIDSEEPINLTS